MTDGLGSFSAGVYDGSGRSVGVRLPETPWVPATFLRLGLQKKRCSLTTEQDKTTMLHGFDCHLQWAELH